MTADKEEKKYKKSMKKFHKKYEKWFKKEQMPLPVTR
jgi:CCR4-NOT transcriptional regulation complex NOT5 subunit